MTLCICSLKVMTLALGRPMALFLQNTSLPFSCSLFSEHLCPHSCSQTLESPKVPALVWLVYPEASWFSHSHSWNSFTRFGQEKKKSYREDSRAFFLQLALRLLTGPCKPVAHLLPNLFSLPSLVPWITWLFPSFTSVFMFPWLGSFPDGLQMVR